jgi:hypothetical protein
MAANGSKTLRPNVRDGSDSDLGGRNHHDRLARKTGHRRRPPRRAYEGPWCIGHRAAVDIGVTERSNGRAARRPSGRSFLGSEERKPDKVPGLTRWDRTRRAGPSGKATGPIQKNRPRLKERGVPINKGGRSR